MSAFENLPSSTSSHDVSSLPKKIDIFQHLKLSLRNSELNCKCPNAFPVYYCIPCKLSVCTECGYDDHIKHILINKDEFTLCPQSIERSFEPAVSYLNNTALFKNYKSIQQEMLNGVDDVVKHIQDKVNAFKHAKYKEVNKLFDNFQRRVDETNRKINDAKQDIMKYMDKHKEFFNITSSSSSSSPVEYNVNSNKDIEQPNSDKGNTVFLLNYDILNIAKQTSLQIEAIAQTISEQLSMYRDSLIKSNNNIINEIDRVLTSLTTDNDDINDDDIESHSYKFISNVNKLQNENYNDIYDRIKKYNLQINSFKKTVYNALKKFGNLREIEKSLSAYETTRQKGADNLFSKRKTISSLSSKDSYKLLYPQTNITKRDDIHLNNPILEKYFAYLTIDLYGDHFKMATKELQSSHADLMIKLDDDEEADYGRALEGTNDIMIYDKRNKRVVKKSLKLLKNPHGYTKFPIGCRSLLLGDKLYITGGKDESSEYANVLIYDRKTNALKRIMDLREERSYHTMIFNEVFETIMIIGGESTNSVEIFDPLTNRWQLLPCMKYPRANAFFYFDESRGIMYAMFGNEGNITDNAFTDVVEYLDLTNIKDGWMKLEYYNKAGLNLKSYLNVCPLNNELMLIYGGVPSRESTRNVCVLNLIKKEINKIDKRLMEALRNEAKKSKKLSSIISTISIASVKE